MVKPVKIPGWGFVVQERVPLSRSLLWQLQRDFYDKSGLEAWRDKGVPCYVTTNPFIAEQYAQTVHACLLDSLQNVGFRLDKSEPVYVVELASGSGEFGFRFLRQLRQLLATRPIPGDVRVCFVMTDFTESNLRVFEQQACFQPFLTDGSLDLALFDCESSTRLELRRSGVVLDRTANPLIVCANYLFDSLPQDAFWIRDGQLREGTVTLTAAQPVDDPAQMLERLPQLKRFFNELPVELPFYGEPAFDAILQRYLELLEQASFLFPISVLRCLDRLRTLAGGRLLLVAADKGYGHIEELSLDEEPHLEAHGDGCFSFMVDFHALGIYCNSLGGRAFIPSRRDDSLLPAVFLFGGEDAAFPRTARAIDEMLEGFGPCDFLNILHRAEQAESCDVEQFISLLKLSRFEPGMIVRLGGKLVDDVEHTPEGTREQLIEVLRRAWPNFYPSSGDDVPLEFGRVFYSLGHYREAIDFYKASLEHLGEHAITLHNLGLCYRELGRRDLAQGYFERALELNPDDAGSRECLAEMAEEPSASS